MSTSFANLKKTQKTSLDSLVKAAEKLTTRTDNARDQRLWKPEVDKSGNGYAVLRFLPAPNGEDVPWVKIYDHGFQGPGGWYIENSRTSLGVGEKDPLSEHNSMLWNSGIESNKDVARKQKRRLKYFSNILIVKDPANPQNEGKVFLYQYGAKIFEKLQNAMQPEFEDESPVNPFDLWEGANFKLKIRNYEGYRNYDKSEFETASPVEGEDSRLEEIWNSQYSLVEFLDPKNFKSYEELQTRLSRVLGNETKPDLRVVTAAPEARSAPAVETDSVPWSTDDDDESLSFFKKLADDD
jgi:hypothetical protein|tara:strand:- start:596 stop:1483 length:888 start_codon:yes stop_codon:yes gene_type:complete